MAERRELKIYNSMTKKKEIFTPTVKDKVSMYVCGVTAYDFSHIGHARAYVAFDVLYRYLRHLGYDVTYVRNFTDIDDKIIKRANEREEEPLELSHRFCEEFEADMADLQCLKPTYQPCVSDHIDEIKDMITKIISNGCAYEVDGDVYFSVDKFPNYGRLSGRKLEDNIAGERIAIDSRKRNPADFALWKAAKPGEIRWDSRWGKGRPGWHIECSAMSATHLSEKFDIHGGGMDLIFPHHENEIAQSCAAFPDSNIRYWMHNGFVTANDEKTPKIAPKTPVRTPPGEPETINASELMEGLDDTSQKMSKSTGNFFTIREVTKLYHPLALRHFLMGTHYRSPVNYSISQIEISSEAIYKIYQTLEDCRIAISLEETQEDGAVSSDNVPEDAKKCISNLKSQVEENLSDDLHTTSILNAVLPDAISWLNKLLDMLKKKPEKPLKLSYIQLLVELEKEVTDVLELLGLLSSLTYTKVLNQLKEKALKRAELTEEDIRKCIEKRASAREKRKYELSDRIRDDLKSKGIALEDVPGKDTTWRPCVADEKPSQTPVKSSDGQLPGSPDTSDGQLSRSSNVKS